MSVLIQLTMFPTDKGESVSKEVSRIIDMIDSRGIDYRLTPMATIMEFETMDEALAVISNVYALLEPDCNRIYASATFDIRKGKSGRMAGKIASVEKKIGKKPRT
jgi:uncharacterized protein (TIGR00106 family)